MNNKNIFISSIDDLLSPDFTNEQQEILKSLSYYFSSNSNSSFNNVKFTLNFYMNNSNNEGKDYEIDSLFLFENKKVLRIFLYEFKDYSKLDELNFLVDQKIKEDEEQIVNKAKNLLNEISKNKYKRINNVYVYIIFAIKKNKKYYFFNKKLSIDKIKNINKKNVYIHKLKLPKKILWCRYNYLIDLFKFPRDINFLMNSIKNPIDVFKSSPINNFSNFWNQVKSKNIISFHGDAGAGKTNLAFALYSELQKNNPMFFMVNDKYCKSLKAIFRNENFISSNFLNSIVWHTNDFEEKINELISKNNKCYVIIDESQRLTWKNIEFIKKTISSKYNIKYFLFGDPKQKINTTDYGDEELRENETSYKNKLKNTFRINRKTIGILEFIFGLSNECNGKIKNIDIEIRIENSFNIFFDLFKEDKNWKVLSSFQKIDYSNNDSLLRDKNIYPAYTKMNKREHFLYIDDFLNNYYFFSYDLISREVESNYVFIPSFISKNLDKKWNITNIKENVALSQLYVLITRATKKLVIYIQDENYFKFCNNRLKEVIYEK